MLVNAVLILLPLGTWLVSEPPANPKENSREVKRRKNSDPTYLTSLGKNWSPEPSLTQNTHARPLFAFRGLSGSERDVQGN